LTHKQAILQAKYEFDVISNSYKTIFSMLCSLLMFEKFYFCSPLARGCIDSRPCAVIPPGNGGIHAQGRKPDGLKNGFSVVSAWQATLTPCHWIPPVHGGMTGLTTVQNLKNRVYVKPLCYFVSTHSPLKSRCRLLIYQACPALPWKGWACITQDVIQNDRDVFTCPDKSMTYGGYNTTG